MQTIFRHGGWFNICQPRVTGQHPNDIASNGFLDDSPDHFFGNVDVGYYEQGLAFFLRGERKELRIVVQYNSTIVEPPGSRQSFSTIGQMP